jgi:uncharacterized membrane protein
VRRSVRLGATVAGEVVIRRPVHEIYRFYRDFTNLPRFLGDVVAVERLTDTTYRWLVAGPLGTRLPMTVTITEERVDRLIRYRTSGPLPLHARWQLSFAPDADAGVTRVREHLVIPLGAAGRAVLALMGKYPDREVAANLATLKQLLEAASGRPVPPSDGDRERDP